MVRAATAEATRGRLPARTRDRRPALAALALLLVVVGGLGAGLAVYRSAQRTDVLVASGDIRPGQKISSDDFTTTRLSADTGAVVHADDEDSFIGSYATVEIPEGTIVNRLMFQVGNVVPEDGVVVGVTLTAEQRPAVSLAAGNVVRAYFVPQGSSSDESPTAGQVLAEAARVVSVTTDSGGSGTVSASLLVTKDIAPPLIAAASNSDVALAVLPTGTSPEIDFEKTSS